jgi:alpha-tubulin suppressor-like RCC1 family protein
LGPQDAGAATETSTSDTSSPPADSSSDAADAGDFPVEISAGGNDTEESPGVFHACARLGTGKVYCWGANSYGELGVDPSTTPLGYSTTPVLVSSLTDATSLSAGGIGNCAIRANKTVVCWGANTQDQLGQPSSVIGPKSYVPVQVQGLTSVENISAGYVSSCATVTNGTAYCWGLDGIVRELGGNGDGGAFAQPIPVDSGSSANTFTQVAVIDGVACGLTGLNRVWCWGDGTGGCLGRASASSTNAPAQATYFGAATSLGAAQIDFCAFAQGDGVYCWGYDNVGQIGPLDGASVQPMPSRIPGFGASDGVVGYSGGGSNTCAVFSDGTVKCLGDETYGANGDGTTVAQGRAPAPVLVQNLTDATAVAAGPYFACALRKGGGTTGGPSVVCWGRNNFGQLGNGNTTDSNVPVHVALP